MKGRLGARILDWDQGLSWHEEWVCTWGSQDSGKESLTLREMSQLCNILRHPLGHLDHLADTLVVTVQWVGLVLHTYSLEAERCSATT